MILPTLAISALITGYERGYYKPVANLISKNALKVGSFALQALPLGSAIRLKYELVKYAASKLAPLNYAVKKEFKSGQTPQALGDFFNPKESSDLIDLLKSKTVDVPTLWSLFEPNFDTKNPQEILEVLKQVYLHTHDPEILQLRIAQLVAKKLIGNCFHLLEKGFEIKIPVISHSYRTELVTYRLDSKFDLWEGIPAFGFVDPENKHPPLLIFRPTNYDLEYKDALPALVANLHPKGPAWKLYKNSKVQIDHWLQEKTLHGQNKARILGYSQGGILAAYFLTYHSQWISQKEEEPSYILDSPGLNSTVAQDWQALENKPYVLSYINRGDLFPKFGSAPIGKAYEVSIEEKMTAFQAHHALSLFSPKWTLREIDTQKEARSSLRKALSTLQGGVGKSLYPLFKEILLPQLQKILYP